MSVTLYISATDNKRRSQRTALVYLLASILCALFGAVYEHFSHEVYSFYMIYAFAFPLVLGCLPFTVISFSDSETYLPLLARQCYHFGVASLTVGSVFIGVLEIYGTTNALSVVYFIVGAVLISAALLTLALNGILRRRLGTGVDKR